MTGPAIKNVVVLSVVVINFFFVSAACIQDANAQHAKFMGTGSCSSSNCHGSVAPVASSTVLQNEYVTWQKHDKHSQAANVLASEDSAIIVKHLGLKDAPREPLCLKCHSTYVPEADRRGEKFHMEDGVSCESCHGPAENWLSSHTSRGTNHDDNVGKGMTDLTSVEKRTALCLSCHFGDDEKTVDHRLIGAGHPRLTFEFDTFESIMPRHWKVDEDYIKRKGQYQSGDAWLQGQAFIARGQVEKMLSKKRSKNGLFPEFTMFSCYSCHHSLVEDQWKKREYANVGEPQLNVSSLIILREALEVVNPRAASSLGSAMSTLHRDFKEGNAEQNLRSIQKTLSDKSLTPPMTQATRRKAFRQLASYGANNPSLPYETAEQVAMALSSLSADDPGAGAVEKDMEALYQSLKSEEEFAPEQFTAAAKRLAQNSASW